MRKSHTLNKLFTSLFLILYIFASPALAIENVLVTEPAQQEEESPVDNSEDILDEGISTSIYDGWTENADGSYTTAEAVVLNETYVYPSNTGVTIKFTKLPEASKPVTIRTLSLTAQEKLELGTNEDVAYEFVTDMADGTFKYVMTLPASGDNSEVVYAENRIGLSDGEVIDGLKTNGLVTITGDHFTVFVVVETLPAGTVEGVDTCTAATVSGVCYDSIQEAIDNASDGDIVNVAPGTYTENILIDVPNLTLQSTDGRDNTIIENPNVGSESWGIGVMANMGTVTIDGFTANNFRNGIGQGMSQSAGTAVIIKNNKIIPENNNTNPYLRNGIQVTGNGSQVLNNYVVGAPLTSNWASSGIGVVNASNVLVKGNTVNFSSADIGISILNYSASLVQNITVEDNHINGAKEGVRISGKNNSKNVQDVIIRNNELINSPARYGMNVQSVALTNLSVTGNTIAGNAFAGMRFSSSSAILDGDIEITDNNISNNTNYGIILEATSTINPVFTITRNDLSGHTYYGIYNSTPHTVNGINNKWGTSKESEIQTLIVGDVTYDPWYGKTANSVLTVNEYLGADGVYYIKGTDTLDFTLAASPVYFQKYIAGLWGYNETTGSRDNLRYIGWKSISPDLLDTVMSVESWDLETTGWMGSNPPGTVIPEGDYLLWAERNYTEGGYVRGSTIKERISVDNTGPKVSVELPETDERISGIVHIEIAAEDAKVGIDSASMHIYQVKESGKTLVPGCTSIPTVFNGTNWEADINNGGRCNLEEGTYEIAAWAYDSVGNPGWAKRIQFVVDETAPATPTGLTIFDEEGNVLGCSGYTNNRRITVDWDNNSETDFDHYIYGIKGNEYFKTFTASQTTGNIRNTDGYYKYIVRAVDIAGNVSEPTEWCGVTLDRVSPEGLFTGILGNAVAFRTNDTTPIVIGTYSDNNGVADITLTVDGKTYTPVFTGGNWTSPELEELAEGTYTATLTVTDVAGNITNVSQDIEIDLTGPDAPTPLSPSNNAYISDTSVLTTEWSSVSGATKYIYESYNDENATDLRWHAEYTSTSKIAHNVADSTFWWRVKAVDDLGNEGQWSDLWKVTIDATAPVVNINTPLDGDIFSGNLVLNATIEDGNLLRYYIRIKDTDTNQVVFSKVVYSDSFSDTEIYNQLLPDGHYEIQLAARDKALNRTSVSSQRINITVDNTAPVMGAMSDMTLFEGETFPTDTVSLTDNEALDKVFVKATDLTNGLGSGTGSQNVSVMIGDQFPIADQIRQAIEDWQGSAFPTIDLNVLPEGQYLIEYYATDMAGNSSDTQSFTVTIENNVPEVSVSPSSTEITVGQPLVLSASIARGNADFTYAWSGACSGTESTANADTTTAGNYTCTVTVTDTDGDTDSETFAYSVGEVAGVATQALGTGGGFYYAENTDTKEEQTDDNQEGETPNDTSEEVKGADDTTLENTTEEKESSTWWIYLIIALVLLTIFFLILKRRKEEENN